MTVAGCGAAASAPPGAASSDGGTTVTYALAPGVTANYIFPFDDSDVYTVYNVDDFQYLLYRPLYWFGHGTSPFMNEAMSLAYPPVYKGQQVTIRLRPGWKWSNGEPVDAQDVIFWMNMMKAEAVPFNQGPSIGLASNWGGFVPGGIPTDVTDIHAVGTYDVQMTISGAFSQTWFTDNELSQITPMPMAWDVTGSGPSNCVGGSISDCRAVYNYLSGLSNNQTADGTSKIWGVVDGAWRVQSLTSQNVLTLVINNKYSGKLPADHVTRFIEEPFTSEQAEYDVLQDPTSNETIDVGYLPTDDAPPPSGSGVGTNPVSLTGYNLSTQWVWQLSYFPYNFANPTAGPIFSKLYFREAFQDLVDQEGTIDGPLHGYGKVTVGPVATYPVTPYVSAQLKDGGDPWPLSVTKAESLLHQNGWSASKSGGTDTCTRAGTAPGDCGAGIKAGTPLDLTLFYATGIDWMASAAKELASNAALAGINLTATGETFQNVIDDLGHPTSWEMAFWGSWTYSPDYLPTGDELFLKGAIANYGDYDNTLNNILTKATLHARTPAAFDQAMYTWEDNLAKQLPVVWEPDTPTLIETIKGLDIGVQNPALTITPEDWHWQT